MAPIQCILDPDAIIDGLPKFSGSEELTIEKYLIAIDEAGDLLGFPDHVKTVLAKGRFTGWASNFSFEFMRVDDYGKFRDTVIELFSRDFFRYKAERRKFEEFEIGKGLSYFVDRYLEDFGGKKRHIIEVNKIVDSEPIIRQADIDKEIEKEYNVERENSDDKNSMGDIKSEDNVVVEIKENGASLDIEGEASVVEVVIEKGEIREIVMTEDNVVVEIKENCASSDFKGEASVVETVIEKVEIKEIGMTEDMVSGEFNFVELGKCALEYSLLPELERESEFDFSVKCREQVFEKVTEVKLGIGRDLCKEDRHRKNHLISRQIANEFNVKLLIKPFVTGKFDRKRRDKICGNLNYGRYKNGCFLKGFQNNLGKLLNFKFRKKKVRWLACNASRKRKWRIWTV